MAYTNFKNCTPQEYKEVIYSGDTQNKIKILFDGVELKNADRYCELFEIESRVIPFGSKVFMLENLVSRQGTLILHDIDTNILQSPVDISIGTLVNNVYEYVPIGTFNIQELPTTDKGKTTITLRDNSVKLDFDYNAQPLIQELGGAATKKQIFLDICDKAGIKTKVTSFLKDDELIAIYDNTVKARKYICYLAGQAGALPIIDRDGELDFVYLKFNVSNKIINDSEVIKYGIGNNILYFEVINNAVEGKLMHFEFGGNTIQESTPTIENPQEMISTSKTNHISIAGRERQAYLINLQSLNFNGFIKYKDKIYGNNNTWYYKQKIASIILDGTNNYFVSKSGSTANNIFIASINNIKSTDTNTESGEILSNMFEATDFTTLATNNITGISRRTDKVIAIGFGLNSEIDTLEKANNWLKEHNVSIMYPLEDNYEIITKITDSVLIENLNEFKTNAKLFNGNNLVGVSTPLASGNPLSLFITYKSKKQNYNIPFYYLEKYDNAKLFKISKVVYESGIIKLEPINQGTDDNDTLFLDSSNPYITTQEQIDSIYDLVNGFEINSLTTGKIKGNPAIDWYDIVEFTNNEDETFKILGNNKLTYRGSMIQTFNSEISLEQRTSNVTKNSNQTFQRYARTNIDNLYASIELISSETQLISDTKNATSQIQLSNAYKGTLHYLSIKGQISLVYPSNDLYPSDDLYPIDTYLLVDDNKVKLDINYLNYISPTICDEFVYEEGKCKIIRRVGIDEDGNFYALSKEVEEARNDVLIEVDSDSTLKMESFDDLIYETSYLLQNDYTNTFAPSFDLISRINLSPGNALIESSKLAKIKSNNIELEGYTSINKNFGVDLEGNMFAKDGTFAGNIYLNDGNLLIGGNGMLSTIIINSNIKSKQYMGGTTLLPLGYSIVGQYSSGNLIVEKDSLEFDFELDEDFTIVKSFIILNHTPIKYYELGTYKQTGFSRNLKLYKSLSRLSSIAKLDYGYLSIGYENANFTEISNAFGETGFTGNNSNGSSTKSIDITKYLQIGFNLFKIETSNSAPTTQADCFSQTGACNAVLYIIGYTKFKGE